MKKYDEMKSILERVGFFEDFGFLEYSLVKKVVYSFNKYEIMGYLRGKGVLGEFEEVYGCNWSIFDYSERLKSFMKYLEKEGLVVVLDKGKYCININNKVVVENGCGVYYEKDELIEKLEKRL